MEDDASPGAVGGCLGLEQPDWYGPKMQAGYHEHSILLDSHAILQKLEKSGQGANAYLLKYIPLLEVRERQGEIREVRVYLNGR